MRAHTFHPQCSLFKKTLWKVQDNQDQKMESQNLECLAGENYNNLDLKQAGECYNNLGVKQAGQAFL